MHIIIIYLFIDAELLDIVPEFASFFAILFFSLFETLKTETRGPNRNWGLWVFNQFVLKTILILHYIPQTFITPCC